MPNDEMFILCKNPVLVSLKSYNSFGVEAFAQELIHIRCIDDLSQIQASAPIKILGAGSNILLTKNIEQAIVKMEIQGIDIIDENKDAVYIRIGGGVIWHDLVLWALQHNLAGIENLSLIPGTVGAAPIQNIGAYGVEIKDVFISLQAWNIEKSQMETFSHDQCNFSYRNSIFKQTLKDKYVICFVTLQLQKNAIINKSYGAINQKLNTKNIEHPGIRDISEAVIEIRNEKLPDPKLIGNAGSFFKNVLISYEQYMKLQQDFDEMPHYLQKDGMVKIPAGWLIESCGWKGKQIGQVACFNKQALVITNSGNASGSEILNFSKSVASSVFEKFGLHLEAEVNIW